MLTLLTPHGKTEALCRGCKRPSSALLTASECFVTGEYVLFGAHGHATVSSCHITETFYPLRQDYDRLRAGSYLLSLCDAAAQPEQDTLGMFTLLARSLFRLAYTERPVDTVVAGFLMHFAALNGYTPLLDTCARCGAPAPSARLFDTENGGVLCPVCSTSFVSAVPLRAGQQEWMKMVLKVGIDKYPPADEDPPVELLKKYVSMRMERTIKY